MNGNKKLFLRLALVVILAVSFLAPLAVGPTPASAVISAVTVTPTPATAGAAAVYAIAGATSVGWAAGANTVVVTFPAGTFIPAAPGAANVTVGPTAAPVAAGAVAVAGQVVTITTGAGMGAVAAAGTFVINFALAAGLANPPASTTNTLTVANTTSAEPAVTSTAYTTTASTGAMKLSTLKASVAEAGAGAASLPLWIAGSGFNAGVALVTLSVQAPALFVSAAPNAIASYNNLGGAAAGAAPAVTGGGATATLTPDAGGNFVLQLGLNSAATAGTYAITALDAGTGATAVGSITITAGAVLNQVKITSGNFIAYADPTQTSTFANVASFAKVGDAFTVAAANTGCANAGCALAPAPATFGDFTAGGAVSVFFDGTSQPLLGSTTIDGTVSAGGNANPNYRTFTTTVLVPTTTGGSLVTGAGSFPASSKTVKVTDGVASIFFNFGVTPKATFSPNSGGTGATITVTGTGFAKSKGVNLFSSGAAVTAANYSIVGTSVGSGITTDATGSFSGTFGALGTTKYISAVDGSGNMVLNMNRNDSTGNTFSIKPTLTLSPTSGKPKDTVTVTGSNFNNNANFEVFLGTQPPVYVTPVPAVVVTGTGLVATGTTDGNGAIPAGTTFQVPAIAQSTYNVYVIDNGASSRNQSSTFTVGAVTATLNPTSAPRGGKVTVSLTSMTNPGATIPVGQMFMGSTAWNVAANVPADFTAPLLATGLVNLDNSGNATFTLRVPATAQVGSNLVQVTDSGNVVAQGTFTVTTPTFTLTPSSAAANSIVSVTGSGWVPDKNVTIRSTDGQINVSATPDAGGNIGTSFTVPLATTPGWGPGATVTFTGSDVAVGNTAAAKLFSVPSAAVTVTPAAAKWGDTVTVAGTGFAGGSVVKVSIPWDNGVTSIFPTPIYTDNGGNFTGTFVLPSVTAGIQTVGALAGNVSATTTITVSAAPVSVATALSSISTQLVRVWGFDGASQTWKLYDPAVPAALNTLGGLSKGQGYFINVSAATSVVSGSGNVVALSPGWNLIGW